MIIVLKQNAPDAQVHEFCRELEGMGLQINDSKGSDTHILGLIGDTKAIAESWVLANPVAFQLLYYNIAIIFFKHKLH